MKHWKIAAVLALSLVAAGCSSDSTKKELPPEPLKKITEQATLKKQWSRSIGDGQGKLYNRLVPAIEGETLYVADAGGTVMALNRQSGAVKWQKDLKTLISGAVGASADAVAVGTLKGQIIALDAASGSEKWRAQASSEVLAPPTVNHDLVLVQSQDDNVFAFDAATGSERWVFDNYPAVLTLRGTSFPLLTDRLGIVALSTGRVLALDVEHGLPIWEQAISFPKGRSELERISDIDGNMLISGNTLYAISYQGKVGAIELDSGRIMWQRDASSYVGVGEDDSNLYISLATGEVEAVDTVTASVAWTNKDLLRRQLTAPVSIGNYIAVGDVEGYVHLLSKSDGHIVGRTRVDKKGIRVRPLVVGSTLYVYGNSGDLAALAVH